MLKVFRRKGVAKRVLWVIAVIIIISFGFGFGLSRFSDSGRSSSAGTIFGQQVSYKEFQKYSHATRNQAIMMSGENYEKILPFLDMEDETWTRIMLVKEAQRKNIKVSDREVISYIASMPTFQREGGFDKKLYSTVITHVFRTDARGFEESMRDQLKIMKLIQSSAKKVKLNDEQIRNEYVSRNKKIKVGYTLIDPSDFAKNVNVNDKELKSHFDAHREDFLVPDSIKLQYVTIPLNEKSSTEDHKKAESSAQDIFQAASKNNDLVSAAKSKKISVQETGFFNMENPDLSMGWTLELWQKAFEAKTGAVLEPVTTSKGMVVAKVADRKVAYIPDFDKAKDTIKQKLVSEKTLELAKDKAQTVRELIAKNVADKKTPAIAVQNAGLSPKETPFFANGDYIPELGISEDFHTAATALNEKNLLSPVVVTSKGPAIIWWEAEQPIDEKKYEELKQDFAKTLYQEESSKAIHEVVQEIRKRANLENNLGNLKRKAN